MNELDLNKLKVDRQPSAAPTARPKRRINIWYVLIALLLLLVAAKQFFPSPAVVQTTQIVSAWPSQQYNLLDSTGYVVARRKAAVASKGTGRVDWLGVSEGDHVKQGTVIARLENHDVMASYQAAIANTSAAEAGVRSAELELSDAQDNLRRIGYLFHKGLTAEINLRDGNSRVSRAKDSVASAKAAFDAARSNQDNAKSALDYTEIRAPFDGVVIARSANVGDIVTPLSSAADAKGAVAVMADMSTLEVNADVSESSLASVHVGQPCEIALDAYPNRRFRGEVSAIVPTVNRASATVTTKVRILDADQGVLPDMSARVSFLSQAVSNNQQKPVLAINPQALAKVDGHDVIYTIVDGKARAVQVTLGSLLGDVQAITANGLKVGSQLILLGGTKIHDGSPVKLAETH